MRRKKRRQRQRILNVKFGVRQITRKIARKINNNLKCKKR